MSLSAPVADSAAESRRGIAWMLVTMLLFVCMDAAAKHLAQSYPVPQVVWARFAFHALLLAAFLGPRLRSTVITRRPALQLARSGLLMVTTILFFSGLYYLPLADASALMQIGPLVVTALSMPLLAEHVGLRRWSGVVIGFSGAMIIVRPGSDAMQLAALFPLAAAATYGLYQIATRLLSRSDAPLTTLFYTPLVGAVVMSAALPFFWRTPDVDGWMLMVLVGLIGGISHFTLIKAFSSAPAATVSPFGYSSLIWAAILGFVLFGDFPDAWTISGAAVIVGSGLYILHREHVRRRPT